MDLAGIYAQHTFTPNISFSPCAALFAWWRRGRLAR